jgi:hypothetical protein
MQSSSLGDPYPAASADTAATDYPAPGEADQVWVVTHVTGRSVMDPAAPFRPPSIRGTLEGAGVQVFEAGRQMLVTAGGGYSMLHYAQIRRDQVELAAEVGFALTSPPRISLLFPDVEPN